MTNNSKIPITIGSIQVDYVTEYIYLGQLMLYVCIYSHCSGYIYPVAVVHNRRQNEIQRRIGNAWKRFWSLSFILTDKTYNLKLRSGVMNSCILPVLLYGAQTWSLTAREWDMLRKCQRKMESKMLNITLRHRLSNEDIRRQTHLKDAAETADKLKKKWAGHVMRLNENRWTHPYDMGPKDWQTQRWKTEDKVDGRTYIKIRPSMVKNSERLTTMEAHHKVTCNPNTEIHVVICEDDTKCNLLLDKAPRCLRKLITIKETRPATNQRAKNRGVEMLRFEDVERLGAAKDNPEVPPKLTDLCTICYTSGTTGNPKGVMLSHENVVAGMCAVILQLGDHRPRSDDIMMSFLPLAHMLERCCENGMYLLGGAVGFFSGDIKRLPEDMKALRPTVMPAVPRLLNRIYDKVMTEISGSFIKRMLFNMAMSAKEGEIRRGIIRNNSFWDKLVFRKVQEGMGGRLRLMVVGSAPLAGNVLTFIRCALGALVVEGYGQTECCAPITLTVQGDHIPEHVGPPVACCCIKLVDVPEMEYYAVSGQGEVCVKGTNVFQGYYKEDEKTNETIDSEGWHHTGDVGMWLPNGTLKIIDRKKHIFKLSQGEYIVPEKIENIYIRSQYVQQVFVCGESLKASYVKIFC
ncbi:hypothetical protein ANN_14585 [Periplaneta americana]|uniref:long-chain-fatty-acid--CoA ligase n=1 Tax=Periplaneta americana TaxID=6978 RepID=A0ABQ8SXC6_PERAM|nr:hypothetical protein ANN_14585 [Periplaneta americana]